MMELVMKRAALTLLIGLAACSTSTQPKPDIAPDVAKDVVDIAAVEVVFQDTGKPSEDVLDVSAGTDSELVADVPVLQCDPGEGCFMDGCSDNGDCQSGWCVQHLGESVCSQTCQEECPQGWSCRQVAGTDPDVVYICVSDYANLCRPCAANSDCTSTGGAEDACLDYGPDGSFCGGPCDGACPWGFSCEEAVTVEGTVLQQCVNDTGECPCTDSSVEMGLTTPCSVTNDAGTCEGKRTCTEDGLGVCDAMMPAEETCNGIDDDCDGDVDEPDLVDGNFINLCDDGNDCTEDKCTGEEGCVNEVMDSGTCDDGNPCTVADHCVEGTCLGDPVECDDQNPCTDNVCTESGGCEYPANTSPCDDDDPCTLADQCIDGECIGTPANCECQVNEDCGALEDGDLCNGTLVCDTSALPYQCVVNPETVVTCPEPDGDNAFCLKAACEPATGQCSFVPDHEGFLCDNADACTVNDKCVDGVCGGGSPVNCNDGNPCTDDVCNSEQGCVHTDNDAPCNDGDICTTNDVCSESECVGGAALDCDDGDLCNGAETCDSGKGCVAGKPLDCDDDNACNGVETCDPEIGCVDGLALDCDDGNPCTGDTCGAEVGCIHTNLVGTPCDDGSLCTEGEVCSEGLCGGGQFVDCNDDNFCTDDTCDPEVGCVTILNQALCDDGDICTTGDQCNLGECVGAGELVCDDGNECTDDSCDAAVGCQFVPNNAACDDGNACTEGDQCGGGWCQGMVDVSCDDGIACTVDSCAPEAGCVHDASDQLCDDGNACTADQCDTEKGCIHSFSDGAACNDGSVCTKDDSCLQGICSGAPACPALEGYTATCNPQERCEYANVDQDGWRKWDVWILMPSGSYIMGVGDEPHSAGPAHEVTFEHGYLIAKYEATVSQYEACQDEAPEQCTPIGVNYDPGSEGANTTAAGKGNHPQNALTWQQAKDFCSWYAIGGRLPSEAEWEYAARGTTDRKYPWGDAPEPTCDNGTAVFNDIGGDEGNGCGQDGTFEVGSKPAGTSWCGAYDMGGNVFEWCEDYRHTSYVGAPTDGTAWLDPPDVSRIVRGGGFHSPAGAMKSATRNYTTPTSGHAGVGVRCVRHMPGDCAPDCDEKDCGPDGCGGICGTCQGPQDACMDSECVCQPECNGMECGPDGCGGVCGTCPGEQDACIEGTCVCHSACDGKECGDDGCGGACGICEGQQDACIDGSCVCQPACDGKECGDDGCGGGCGTCQGPQDTCVEGSCVCQPACDGKECGDDGCGGECGTCQGQQDLCEGGTCICQPACDGKECGDDGCGGSCGACDDENGCTTDSCDAGVCVFSANSAPCDDGNNCTVNDQCLNGTCSGGTSCEDMGMTCLNDGCVWECNEWTMELGGAKTDEALAVAPTSTAGAIVGGWTRSGGDPYGSSWAFRLSHSGAVEWEKKFGKSGSEEQVLTVLALSDGAYALGGDKGTQPWLAKVTTDGQLMWEKTYSCGGLCWVYDLSESNSGELAVAGNTHPGGLGNPIEASTKLVASNGLVIWEKGYGNDNGVADHADSIAVADDGSIVVYVEGGSRLMRYSGSGALLFDVSLKGMNTDIEIAGPNSFLVGHLDSTAKYVRVGKYDLDGNEIWLKTIGSGSGRVAVDVQSDGDILVLNGNFAVSRLASDGTKLETKQWAIAEGRAHDLVGSPDGGLFIVGRGPGWGAGTCNARVVKTCAFQ